MGEKLMQFVYLTAINIGAAIFKHELHEVLMLG